jgi:uncharacterized protein Usg
MLYLPEKRAFIREVLLDESYKDDILWHLSTLQCNNLRFPASVDHYILTFYRVAEEGRLYIYIQTYLYTHTHNKSILREGIIWYKIPQHMVKWKVFVFEKFDLSPSRVKFSSEIFSPYWHDKYHLHLQIVRSTWLQCNVKRW